MEFFIIENSLDPKVLGNYPQVRDIKHSCHIWDEPKFIEHWRFKNIPYDPITSNGILYSKSKLTDLINITGVGFTLKPLLSGKLKSIIEAYKTTSINFYRSSVIQNGIEIEDYWILYANQESPECIDFEKSTVLTRNKQPKGGTFLQEVQVANLEDFESQRLVYKNLFVQNIFIKENTSLDFFALQNVEGGIKYLVSEKLKVEIEKHKCTGILFRPEGISLNAWLG